MNMCWIELVTVMSCLSATSVSETPIFSGYRPKICIVSAYILKIVKSRWECSSMYITVHVFTFPIHTSLLHTYTPPPPPPLRPTHIHTPNQLPPPPHTYAVGPKKKSTMIANDLANDFRKTKIEPVAQVRTPKNTAWSKDIVRSLKIHARRTRKKKQHSWYEQIIFQEVTQI